MGLASNLYLKGKRGENIRFFSPFLEIFEQWVELEREMRETPYFYDLRRLGGLNPSTRQGLCMGTDNTQFCRRFRVWRRKVRERNSDLSLRSTELGWSSRAGTRLKVRVLCKGYLWISETLSFAKVSRKRFGESKASGSRSVRGTFLGRCSCFKR